MFSFRPKFVRAASIARGLHSRPGCFRLLVAASALALTVAACSKSDEDEDGLVPNSKSEHERAKNPPYLLNDDLVERVIGALKDLRLEFARQLPPADPKTAGRTITVGVGITNSVARSAEFVKLHGFQSVAEFEQALAHVQRAMSVALMSDTRGFDSASLRQRLDESQQVMIKELESTKRDQALTPEARSSKIAEIQASIAEYQRHLDEVDDLSATIKSESSAIPDQNVAAAKKYLEELKAALAPLQVR